MVEIITLLGGKRIEISIRPLTGTIANVTRANDAKDPRVLVAFTPDDRRWFPVAQVRRT